MGPENDAVLVKDAAPEAESVVNAPVDAVEAPIGVLFTEPPVTATPLAEPPVIDTLLEFWVAIEPRPRFVLEVEALATSERLLAESKTPAPPLT